MTDCQLIGVLRREGVFCSLPFSVRRAAVDEVARGDRAKYSRSTHNVLRAARALTYEQPGEQVPKASAS